MTCNSQRTPTSQSSFGFPPLLRPQSSQRPPAHHVAVINEALAIINRVGMPATRISVNTNGSRRNDKSPPPQWQSKLFDESWRIKAVIQFKSIGGFLCRSYSIKSCNYSLFYYTRHVCFCSSNTIIIMMRWLDCCQDNLASLQQQQDVVILFSAVFLFDFSFSGGRILELPESLHSNARSTGIVLFDP